MNLRRILRRSTRPGDARFIASFGEFWLIMAGVAMVFLAIGLAIGAGVLDPLCLL